MITIFFYLIFHFETRVDFYVWKAQIKDDSIQEYDRQWHRWKFAMWMLVAAFIYACTHSIFTVLAAGVVRLLVMQVEFNRIRGLPAEHLGTNAIDAACNKYLGKTGTLLAKISLFTFTFIYEFKNYETITKEVFRILLPH